MTEHTVVYCPRCKTYPCLSNDASICLQCGHFLMVEGAITPTQKRCRLIVGVFAWLYIAFFIVGFIVILIKSYA